MRSKPATYHLSFGWSDKIPGGSRGLLDPTLLRRARLGHDCAGHAFTRSNLEPLAIKNNSKNCSSTGPDDKLLSGPVSRLSRSARSCSCEFTAWWSIVDPVGR